MCKMCLSWFLKVKMKYQNICFSVMLLAILLEKASSCPFECSMNTQQEFGCYNVNIEKLYTLGSPCENNSTLKISGSNISNPLALDFQNFLVEKVQFLDLNNNNIIHVDLTEFCKFEQLHRLRLSHNQIKRVQAGNINCSIINLSILNLDYNNLSQISFNLFKIFPELGELNLSFNQISELSDCPSGFALKSLKILNLSNNKLEKIIYNAFSCVNYLNNLNLQMNSLTEIDPRVFQNLVNLKYLNLSYNNLESIHQELFHPLSSLVRLDLSNNKLKSLHQYTFQMLPQMQSLDINNNQIQNFYIDDLVDYSNLYNMSLDHNLWDCKNLSSIYRTLHQRNISVLPGKNYTGSNVIGIACKSSETVQNPTESTVTTRQFVQNNKPNIITENSEQILSDIVSETELDLYKNFSSKKPENQQTFSMAGDIKAIMSMEIVVLIILLAIVACIALFIFKFVKLNKHEDQMELL